MKTMTDEYTPTAPTGESELCPACESSRMTTEIRTHRFLYGTGTDAVELHAEVPVLRCGECGFEFLDEGAEELRHEAVCRHLGVLTPAEIRAIRKEMFGLSRSEFAALTGIGDATIARWESGSHIQNVGYDRYLRLLTYADNHQRLMMLAGWESNSPRLPQPLHPPREPNRGSEHQTG